MIFLTVGTQLPFDRLVKAMDDWAERNPAREIFGQVGDASYLPRHFTWCKFLSPEETRTRIREASLVVAHAGIGTILSALENGKPILVLPRRAKLNEHRSEHQVATARYFVGAGLIESAEDEASLQRALDNESFGRSRQPISPFASQELIDCIKNFVNSADR